jgi:hypothetical protein
MQKAPGQMDRLNHFISELIPQKITLYNLFTKPHHSIIHLFPNTIHFISAYGHLNTANVMNCHMPMAFPFLADSDPSRKQFIPNIWSQSY